MDDRPNRLLATFISRHTDRWVQMHYCTTVLSLLLTFGWIPATSHLGGTARSEELDLDRVVVRSRSHWAYSPPRRTAPPDVSATAWSRNAIDRFVVGQLEQHRWHPSPTAEPGRLIRRVSLALTGLPPSIEQVDTFIRSPTHEAYEQFVEACLRSPRYGERWAQPWLDLARYADSNGFQADQLRDSWAYRDWVIAAMNDDMPFDQFAIEQLAGDLLPGARLDQRIATGFHRAATCNVEAGVHPEENRINQVFDRVNTTGTVFLGTTIECCQCHDHKYDPFTQEDYYRLFAFFNNTPLEVKLSTGVQYNFDGPALELPLETLRQARKNDLLAELSSLEEQRAKLSHESREALQQQLADAIDRPVVWHPIRVVDFEATGGESYEVLDDQSILVGGSLPSTSIYNVKIETDLNPVTGFRLEALTHDSLPGRGPGRGDDERTSFILSELSVSANTGTAPRVFEDIRLTHPIADFSQSDWPVAHSIDGDRQSGWAIAPRFGESHWATYAVETPLDRPHQKTKYRFLIDQNHGHERTLGRIGLLATTADPVVFSMPEEVQQILRLEEPNAEQLERLNDYVDRFDPVRLKLDRRIESAKKQLDEIQPATTLVMVEMDRQRETFKLVRGNYLNPGKRLEAGVPANLHPMDPSLPDNRLGLAQWLVDRSNPLIARVTVNRWWTWLFGRGLVLSPEDLGTRSEPPTHPELLDWLAVEFMESGWSRKHIHKLIVMSATFRQSAKIPLESRQRDPLNQFYSRGPRVRMAAEMVRDNSLSISGLLTNQLGGPPVMPFQPDNIWRAVGRNAPVWKEATNADRFRRGIYVVWRRAAPYPSFVNFDAPDRAACVVDRSRTNTPLQALTLLNDRSYLETAVALADAVTIDVAHGSARDRIAHAMRRCVARIPAEDEIDELVRLYESELARFQGAPETAARFLNASWRREDTDQPASPELAAMAMVANVLLNLDETINY